MRRLPTILAGLTAVAMLCVLGAFAAQAVRPPHSPDRLAGIEAVPTLDGNGTAVAFVLKARFCVVTSEPSGLVESHDIGSVEVDLVRAGDQTVTVGAEVYTYRELATVLQAVAAQEWRKVHPAALPTRRATRSQ